MAAGMGELLMAARTRHRPAHDSYSQGDHYALGELQPNERIGPPLPSRWRKTLLWCVNLLIASDGAWGLLSGRLDVPDVQDWLRTASAALSPTGPSPSTDRKLPAPPERLPPISTEEPVPTTQASAFTVSPSPQQPDAGPGPAKSPPLTTASLQPSAADRNEPLPPVTPDPADRYQVRAAAIGLHPDLSRVLLRRLSDTDYRNAGIAIQKAMAEASDSDVFVWPHQRKPELALFKVHFVPGAAPDCRRYVVSVTKDGWLTTALPMEKCGSALRQARRG